MLSCHFTKHPKPSGVHAIGITPIDLTLAGRILAAGNWAGPNRRRGQGRSNVVLFILHCRLRESVVQRFADVHRMLQSLFKEVSKSSSQGLTEELHKRAEIPPSLEMT